MVKAPEIIATKLLYLQKLESSAVSNGIYNKCKADANQCN